MATPNPLFDSIAKRYADMGQGSAMDQYKDDINRIAAEEGVDPKWVTAVMRAESAGKKSAVSKKGAAGLMQLMPGTAREMGVEDSNDPLQNIRGGSRYLKMQLDAHGGDPALALAAYNAGPANVKKYGGIPPFPETQEYVKKVQAYYDGREYKPPARVTPPAKSSGNMFDRVAERYNQPPAQAGTAPAIPPIDQPDASQYDIPPLAPTLGRAGTEQQGRLSSAGGQFMRGFGSIVASVPKAVGEGAIQLANKFGDDPIWGNPDNVTPEETWTYKAGGAIEKWFNKFAVNPEYRDEFWTSKVASGAGTLSGFFAGGIAGRLAKIPALATTMGLGATATAVEGVDDYLSTLEKDETADPKIREQAFNWNAVLGTSEALPVMQALNVVDRFTGGGVKAVIKQGVKGGLEELVQEVFQSVGQNKIAKDFVGYDPERGLWAGAAEAGEVGFVLGFAMNTLAAMMGARRAGNTGAPADERDVTAPEPGATAPEIGQTGITGTITQEQPIDAAAVIGGEEAPPTAEEIGRKPTDIPPPEAAEGDQDQTGPAPGVGAAVDVLAGEQAAPEAPGEQTAEEARDRINYFDNRLKRETYRNGLSELSDSLQIGGDVSYITDEAGTITGRTPSLNPDWYQSMMDNSEFRLQGGVKGVWKAVEKALAGERLGVRQSRVIEGMLDQMQAERTDQQNLEYARRQLEIARQARAAAGIPDAPDWLFEEEDYPDNADGLTRTFMELQANAHDMNPELGAQVDTLMESQQDDAAIISAITTLLEGFTRGRQSETSTQIDQAAQAQAGVPDTGQEPIPGEPAPAGGPGAAIPAVPADRYAEQGARPEPAVEPPLPSTEPPIPAAIEPVEAGEVVSREADRRQKKQPGRKKERRAAAAEQRRRAWAYRKEIDAMSPKEKDAVIKQLRQDALINRMSGLGSRMAWEDAEKKANIASIDADSLKYINDKLGNKAGDELLVKIGKALKHEFGDDAYHISGDEYWVHSDDSGKLRSRLDTALENLKGKTATGPGGTVTGLAFSFGIAENEDTADRLMKADKQARTDEGLRVERGERPAGVVLKGEQEKEDAKREQEAARPDGRVRDEERKKESREEVPAEEGGEEVPEGRQREEVLGESLASLWDKYDGTGEIPTIEDFVDEVEALIDEGTAPASLQSAVDAYRSEQEDDFELGGRNDMDQAESRFVSAVKEAGGFKDEVVKKAPGKKGEGILPGESVELGARRIYVNEITAPTDTNPGRVFTTTIEKRQSTGKWIPVTDSKPQEWSWGAFQRATGRYPNVSQDTGKKAPGKKVAEAQQLFVEYGDRRFEVKSFEDASKKAMKFVAQTGAGASQLGGFPFKVVDQNGKQVAVISYNGRVWNKEGKGRKEIKLRDKYQEGVEKELDELEAATFQLGAPEGEVVPDEQKAKQDQIDLVDEANEAATSPKNDEPLPTAGQKEAGNYKKGHISMLGLDITIENPAGSMRTGTDSDGETWSQRMKNHYGYIKRTEGADGDHVDVFLADNAAREAGTVFVIDQINPKTGAFDEHKVVIGPHNQETAHGVYQANYQKGWQGAGAITEMDIGEFKEWVKTGDTTKPLLYKEPKKAPGRKVKAAPAAEKKAPGKRKFPKEYGAKNKVFKQSDLDEAMASLKGSLGQLNTGLDPKQMSALITVAGFHIEAGARKFVDFSAAMVKSLGEDVRPYLAGLYENIRRYPGMDAVAGEMDATEQVDTETAKLEAEATDEDRRKDEELDQAGARPAGTGRRVQPVRAGGRRPGGAVEGVQPEDVSVVEGGEPVEAAGPGVAGEGVGRPGRAGTRGDVGDGRAGAGGEKLVSGTRGTEGGAITPAGARPAVEPEVTDAALPVAGNFYLENPLEIVGGGQVARFEKNQKAIELYLDLQSEGRHPTYEEQKTIAGYTGWGSFGQELFKGSWENPAPKDGWEKRDTWLRQELGKENWESAQRSITNAHYTDPPTVMAMWDMVQRMGFKGGKVLEPSMGIGNFFGMMPTDLQHRSLMTGIELDELTGGMAKMLYPDANISIKGYQDSHTPDDFYDLVIGNWPFENTVIADRRYNRLSPFLHDYFFLKALDQVRPGGLVVGITSKGTLDKLDKNIRIALAKKAELVAAYRLPSGAFQEYAGTKVVTDIIILKKRPAKIGILTEADNWISSLNWKTTGEDVSVNEFYHANKDNVVGEIDYGHGTTFGRAGLIVHRPDDMQGELKRIVNMTPGDVYKPTDQTEHIKYITNHTDDRQGSLVSQDDGFFVVRGEHLVAAADVKKYAVKSAPATRKREAQFRALINMRKLYADLIENERADNTAEATKARKALKSAYDSFRGSHGPLRKSFGLKYIKAIDDPFFTVLAALETNTGTRETPVWTAASILKRSTARGRKNIENPTVSDAFVIARNISVDPSLEQIAGLAKRPEAEVKAELLASGAVFEVLGGDIEPADTYLSGNVRSKLRQVQALIADGHPELEPSAKALEGVIPKDIPYHEIDARMGATWISTDIYKQYIGHMLNLTPKEIESIDVTFIAGRWKVKYPPQFNNKSEASVGYGSGHKPFKSMVNAAISNQSITIKGVDPITKKTYVNDEATKEVAERLSKIREDFTEWVWKEPERRIELEREYNEARNSWANPVFDGSFLTFEGMALQFGDQPFNLRKHQTDAIWRAIVSRRSLNAHEVGTGKTFTIGGIAVESRRYGIAKKPLILAHNANSASVAVEIQEMYPAAKVLYIDNLSPKTIGIRLRQIANDDWDAIVMPHSLIDRLSLKEETLMGMAQEEIAALEQEAKEAAEEDGVVVTDKMLEDEEELRKLRSPTAKDLVKARNKILETIKKHGQRASREDAIPFEDLGIDMIMVDEVHEFKKPTIVTKMRMKGLNTQTSNRSLALQFLTRYTRANNNGGNVHTFSGTPITNTLTEIYHQMRYIMEDEMTDASIDYWDGWFGSFASEVTDVELNAAAQYESVTRLAAFINVPELRKMLGQYMDVVFSETMPEMKSRETASGKILNDKTLTEQERAELENGRTEGAKDRPYKKIITDTADMTPAQVTEFNKLLGYAKSWQQMGGKDRWEAMLSGSPESPIITEGLATKASFDSRLLKGQEYAGQEGKVPDDPNSKASRAVKNVLEIYKSHDKATQAVFTEIGLGTRVTRSSGRGEERKTWTEPNFSTARDIVERLVDGGIPREEIALITGSTTKEKRKETADAMNRADIRVVIGNSKTLGVGVNMQKNLRALHHMDAPWMPGDLEQRNGRGHRQGNQWNTVLEYRYITDRLDGRRWQILSIKSKFINAFLSAKNDDRTIEGDAASDEQDDILSTFAEAAGDPRVLLKEKIKKKIERLQSKERLHTMSVSDSIAEVRRLKTRIKNNKSRMATAERIGGVISANLEKYKADKFEAVIGGKKFTDRKKTDAAIAAIVVGDVRVGGPPVDLGTIMGFPVAAVHKKLWPAPGILIDIPSADNVSEEGELTGDILDEKEAYKANVASVASTLRADLKDANNIRGWIEDDTQSMERMEEVSKEKFKLAPALKSAEQELVDIEQDMEANPVPPPAWLRQGAPVDTDVRWNDKTFTVTGHRYTPDGWFVLGEDAKGAVVMPYTEISDEQGFPIYEEREFVAPEVIEKEEKEEGETPQYSKYSTSGRKNPKGMAVDQVQEAINGFVKRFRSGLNLTIRVAADKESAFGPAAITGLDEGLPLKGGYYPESRTAILVASDLENKADAVATLRHEILAHHGLNTFDPDGKREILEAVSNSRSSPSLKEIWRKVDRDYENLDELGRAEEVIARIAQSKQGIFTKAWAAIVRAIRRAMKAVGLIDNTTTQTEVKGLINSIERRLDRGEPMRTFPDSQVPQFQEGAQAAPIFYSQMRAVLADKLNATGKTKSYKDQIDSFRKKGLFKNEEYEWSGVNEWLDSMIGRKISKAEVLQFLDANQIQVKEVLKGGDTGEQSLLSKFEEMKTRLRSEYGIKVESDYEGFPVSLEINNDYWLIQGDVTDNGFLDEDGDIDQTVLDAFYKANDITRNTSIDILIRDFVNTSREIRLNDDMGVSDPASTQFDEWQLPGGEDYQELLLTLPTPDWMYEGRKDAPSEAAANQVFRSEHFMQPNIVAHARFNTRTGPDGERILFIEEVQSDWHQKGRKKGYRGVDPVMYKVTTTGSAMGDIPLKDIFETEEEAKAEVEKRNRVLPSGYHGYIPMSGKMAPNAPFKTTWPMLVMKRMIRYAADNGYDKIAWTTGEQQNQRYNLSNYISELTYVVDGVPGKSKSNTLYAKAKDGRWMPTREVQLSELDEYIGAEMAKEIRSRVDAGENTVNITDLNLNVGGKGMIGFYDKMLPSQINKYVKKWGAKAGVTEVYGGEEADVMNGVEADEGYFEAHSIDITPEMKAAATQEQPMFSKGDRRTPGRDYTEDQEEAMEAGGFGDNAIERAQQNPLFRALGAARDRLEESKQVWKTILRQGFLDQYDSFRTIIDDKRAWMTAQLSESAGGVIEAALEYGRPFMNQSAVDVDVTKDSLSDILEPLGTEVNDWLKWIAGNRAERLAAEDRERLFSETNIDALISLSEGKMADGRDRAEVYESVRVEFEKMNDAFVKIGVDTGIIGMSERNQWKQEGFYVPFYRLAQEAAEKVRGPYTDRGLVRQTAYKRLTGADIQINDLLTNVIMNWTHITSAGLKNQAAVQAIASAEEMGLAEQVDEADKSKDAVFVRLGGKKVWLELDQSKEGQLVLESLMSLNYEGMNNFMMRLARKFKRVLTYGVTASPEFKAANLIRDSVQAVAVAGMSTNIAKNIAQGFRATGKNNPTIARMIAGGGAFGDSGYIHGSDPEALQRLIKKDIDRMTILDNPGNIKKMWDKYQDFGARLENVNRAANFEQDMSRGVDLLTANFNARDHLDFQRSGAFKSIRIITQVVPFLNARMQGIDKLGRSGMDPAQRKQFAAVVGVYSLAATLLYLYMKDDDDYDEAPQWERDTYHLFKIPGSDTMYRIPRPFEVGFIASMVERATEQMVNDEVHGTLFFERLWHGLAETLSFNPIPQMIMPAMEVWANKNTFTDRQIESEGMKSMSPSERRRAWTSETAIAMSKGFDAILWDDVVLSPVQIEHLVNGYFGWIGGTILESIDGIVRNAGIAPDSPEWRIQDYPLVGRFARTGPTRGTRYLTEFYENMRDANRAYADIRFAAQVGDKEKARRIAKEKEGVLSKRGGYAGAQRSISRINKQIMMLRIKKMPAESKRIQIERLTEQKNEIAKRAAEQGKKAVNQ